MKFILIGNYGPDRQESMWRFAKMLESGITAKGLEVELWQPIKLFGRPCKNTTRGFAKWLGYMDKWIVYPVYLKIRSSWLQFRNVRTCYHICDHSNAFYIRFLPPDLTGITCHDVLAIRGAMGYKDAYCPASPMGKILQKQILRNLSKAKKLAAVSNLTLAQLNEIAGPGYPPGEKNWLVILNAFNAPFTNGEKSVSGPKLRSANIDIAKPYVLHVGSALQRKNRKLLVLMLEELSSRWSGNVIYAGQPIDETLKALIEAKGLSERVISVVKPPHDLLEALYNHCYAFIFPSYSEGFGWPVIEAQACGAPVITSNIEPMPEVSGNAALLSDPDCPAGFAAALLSLENNGVREELISRGLKNSQRFSLDIMTDAYLKLHNCKAEII